MRSQLRKADAPQSAFAEAWGEVRSKALSQSKGVTINVATPALQTVREDILCPVRPRKRRSHSGTRDQKTIQYP